MKKDKAEVSGNNSDTALSASRRCICCSKELKPMFEDDRLPEDGCWLDAVVAKVTVGYGSQFDGNDYVIGVCDECLNSKVKDGIVECRRMFR